MNPIAEVETNLTPEQHQKFCESAASYGRTPAEFATQLLTGVVEHGEYILECATDNHIDVDTIDAPDWGTAEWHDFVSEGSKKYWPSMGVNERLLTAIVASYQYDVYEAEQDAMGRDW
jgi:hypothetical protein